MARMKEWWDRWEGVLAAVVVVVLIGYSIWVEILARGAIL